MDKEKVTEELVRQNGNQAAAVMADYAGQGGGGSTGGVTLRSVVIPQEATEEQRSAVSAALAAINMPNAEASGRFIPAASIDDMPLAIANVDDEGDTLVLLPIGYNREEGTVSYISEQAGIEDSYIAIDGGFGSWAESGGIG